MRILLLQVRDDTDAERQEVECFESALGAYRQQLELRNLVPYPELCWPDVRECDVLLLGGAGRHSATQTYPFSGPLDDVLSRWIEDNRPFFGSCYGHHVLARLYGGEVVEDKATEEIGTFEISLTASGRADPLFGGLPASFPAQLGHHDRVRECPAGLVELARSQRCGNQALRVADRPAYSTQFHPEITVERMRERLWMYRDGYLDGAGLGPDLLDSLEPTPDANRLLERFFEVCC